MIKDLKFDKWVDVLLYIKDENMYIHNIGNKLEITWSHVSDIIKILVQKHRNGPTGKVELYFNEETTSFRSIAKHYEDPSS